MRIQIYFSNAHFEPKHCYAGISYDVPANMLGPQGFRPTSQTHPDVPLTSPILWVDTKNMGCGHLVHCLENLGDVDISYPYHSGLILIQISPYQCVVVTICHKFFF